jgi:hypothetical protein
MLRDESPTLSIVMAALVAAIHVFSCPSLDGDGRDSAFGRPGHDV